MYDLAVGLVIFVLVFGSLYYVWGSAERSLQNEEIKLMEQKAFSITEVLLRTPGQPENWHGISGKDIVVIGLAAGDRVLDWKRLQRFYEIGDVNYDGARRLMGLGGYGYYFSAEGIEDFNSGRQPADGNCIVGVSRTAVYGGEDANVTLVIYRPR